MNSKRRELMQFAGGAAVGALFTPAPWRLVTDTALWSENWPGIPRPARGEIRTRFTTCSLCDAGCPLKVRCVGEQPVAVAGARGGLCPFGVTAHHLPYHPSRLRQGPIDEARTAYQQALAGRRPDERVAVLDLRPGRTASWTLRRAMAKLENGVYFAPRRSQAAVDFESARTVLSLGTPLLDGWIPPARIFGVRDRFRLIQVEPVESRTAVLADAWLPNLPGSEDALIGALAGDLPPAQAAFITGIPEARIEALGRELRENGPAVVIDSEMSDAVIGLNQRLGSKALRLRAEAPVPDSWKDAVAISDLASLPDRSLRVLVIDASAGGSEVPWSEVNRKLAAPDALVIAFSPLAMSARYVLPTAVFPETAEDIPSAPDSVGAAFRVATPLVPAPAGMVNAAEFLGIAGDPLRERADAIHATGKGRVESYADGSVKPVAELKADEFWKALETGRWIGDVASSELRSGGQAWRRTPPVQRMVSPILSKLDRESDLRLGPGRVALHPSAGFTEGVRVRAGERLLTVTIDSRVPPGLAIEGGWPESVREASQVVRA
jgi:hypothetical protein